MRALGIDRRSLLLITVAALGYFVDIYDLVLFNVVKRESLEFILGPGHPDIKDRGIDLFNIQMAGMLVGGILWGIWGDKRGRISVLFGSILLYSAANIANAFTFDLTSYAIVRFMAGVGLAGELGAGITLIAETMPREKRGYGTMIVVVLGARERAVEIDDVDALGAGLGELGAQPPRLVVIDHRGVAQAVGEAHRLAAEQIDRGEDLHERTKFSSRRSPTRWLFSGWNWQANRLSRRIAAQNRPPQSHSSTVTPGSAGTTW